MRGVAVFAATATPPVAAAVCNLEQTGVGPAADAVIGHGVVAVDGITVDAHGSAGWRYGQDAVLPTGAGEDQRVAERLPILGQRDAADRWQEDGTEARDDRDDGKYRDDPGEAAGAAGSRGLHVTFPRPSP